MGVLSKSLGRWGIGVRWVGEDGLQSEARVDEFLHFGCIDEGEDVYIMNLGNCSELFGDEKEDNRG